MIIKILMLIIGVIYYQDFFFVYGEDLREQFSEKIKNNITTRYLDEFEPELPPSQHKLSRKTNNHKAPKMPKLKIRGNQVLPYTPQKYEVIALKKSTPKHFSTQAHTILLRNPTKGLLQNINKIKLDNLVKSSSNTSIKNLILQFYYQKLSQEEYDVFEKN